MNVKDIRDDDEVQMKACFLGVQVPTNDREEKQTLKDFSVLSNYINTLYLGQFDNLTEIYMTPFDSQNCTKQKLLDKI